jgi:NAD(P)-dependent dehydrogenase (short-subunit alcohol dehydrogenase family)
MGELDGQVAVVTGGGRGIGRAISLALSEAGAAIAVTGRSTGPLDETVATIRDSGGCALAIPTDVTDWSAMQRTVQRTEAELGPVTLLVNNAGAVIVGPVAEADPDEWWGVVETNLRGTFLGCRAVLPGMLTRGTGRIINLAGGGMVAPWPEVSAYGSAKAAVSRLTDVLAMETAGRGVQVFLLSPGLVEETAMGKVARAYFDTMLAGNPYGFLSGVRSSGSGSVPATVAARACVFLAAGHGDVLSGRFIDSQRNLADLVERAEEIHREDLLVLRQRSLSV